MQTLPRPLPDELLCSTLARATYRHGLWSPKRFLDILYGKRSVVAVPDLPTNLASLTRSAVSHWKLSVEELAVRHTLFPYYTRFRDDSQRKLVLAAMAADGGSLQLRLGVCAGSARAPKRFRLCPECHRADIASFGEAYWHRAHHLPGVLVCCHHGAPLLDTEVPFRPPGRHAYRPAPIQVDLARLPPVVGTLTKPEVAHEVARRSFELLVQEPGRSRTIPNHAAELASNLAGPRRLQRLRLAFLDHFGEDLLRASFGREDVDPVSWLDVVVHRPNRPLHPFKHVLLEVLCARLPAGEHAGDPVAVSPAAKKRWALYRCEHLRQEAASLAKFELKTNAIAWALDVDWKTADRLLAPLTPRPLRQHDTAPDRQAWTELAKAYPELGKKALRAADPALYARLYRHDRQWLLAWRRPKAPTGAKTRARIDWARRDLELEARVRQQIAASLGEDPPRRVSRSHVLGCLGLRSQLEHRSKLLPRTSAALADLCESVEEFQLRRLSAVLRKAGGKTLPEWMLWRQARIQCSRLPDGGKDLLARALALAATPDADTGQVQAPQ